MECIKCKNEMTRAKLFMFGGMEIQSETKSVFETPETSPVEVYVCSKCGYIELKATNHKKF
jgi:rubrerythrin